MHLANKCKILKNTHTLLLMYFLPNIKKQKEIYKAAKI